MSTIGIKRVLIILYKILAFYPSNLITKFPLGKSLNGICIFGGNILKLSPYANS